MKRLLIVSRFCKPDSWHGAAQYPLELAKKCRAHGIDACIVSGEYVVNVVWEVLDGIQYVLYPLKNPSSPVGVCFADFNYSDGDTKNAGDIIDKFDPDLIHFGVFARLSEFFDVASSRKIPVTAMVHDPFWACPKGTLLHSSGVICSGPENEQKCIKCFRTSASPRRKLFDFYMGKALSWLARKHLVRAELATQYAISQSWSNHELLRSKVRLFIHQTSALIPYLRELGITDGRTKLLFQGLNENRLIRYQSTCQKPDKGLAIGFVGRGVSVKGFDVLIHALIAVADYSNWHALIVQKDFDKETLVAKYQISPELADRFSVETSLSGAQVSQEIAGMDVLIVPSKCIDIGPRVVLEALAQGVPCVVSSSIGHSDIIEKFGCGSVIKNIEVGHLSSELKKILEHPQLLDDWRANIPTISTFDEMCEAVLSQHFHLLEAPTDLQVIDID